MIRPGFCERLADLRSVGRSLAVADGGSHHARLRAEVTIIGHFLQSPEISGDGSSLKPLRRISRGSSALTENFSGSFVLIGLSAASVLPYLGLQGGTLSLDERAELLFAGQL